MTRLGYSVVLVVLFAGQGVPAAEGPDDKKSLQGKWALTHADETGKLEEIAKTSERFFHMIFSGDKVATEYAGGKEEATYKIDDSGKVKTINFTATTGDDKGKTMLGIYTLDGDTLKLSVAEPGKKRPTDFKSKKDEVSVFVLKRVK